MNEELSIVGAKKRTDGTLDLSSAVTWKRSEQKVTQPASIKEPVKSTSSEGLSEIEKSRERIAELVLKNGGIRVVTSITKDLSPRGSAGFQSLETRIQDGLQSSSISANIQAQFLTRDDVMRGQQLKGVLEDHHIREVIDIRGERQQIYEKITIPGKKGVLGIGKTQDSFKQQPTGRFKPTLHSEIVNGGKNEPAVRITYYIPQSEWRDYSGRTGQMMSVEIVLPDSIAKEVEGVLESDPVAMRTIVEKVMKKKLLKDPQAWETPQHNGDSLRPPYEKWDAELNGGRIYIQKEGKEPGFYQESVRTVRP